MEKIKLGTIFEYLPKTKLKASDGKSTGKYKFFTSSNVQNKFVDDYTYNGEYLIFGTGGKASINYCNEKFSTSSDNFVVRVNKEFNTKLIYLYFKHNIQILQHGFRGASIQHISKEYINGLEIKKHDMHSQNEIIKKYNSIQEIVDLRKKQMQTLDQLCYSKFIKMFHFADVKTEKLENICNNIFAGGDLPQEKFSKEPTETFCIPVYSNAEKNEGLYGYTDTYKVNQPSLTISARGTVGYVAIRNVPFYPIVRLITIIPNSNIVDLNYLKYALTGLHISVGTSIPQLTVPTVKQYSIPVPPIQLQRKFADSVYEIEQNKISIENSLTYLQKIQETLLTKYFE